MMVKNKAKTTGRRYFYRLVWITIVVAIIWPRMSTAQYQWPIEAPTVTQDYACKGCVGSGYHSGIDLTSAILDCGSDPIPVRPIGGGSVFRTVYGCVEGDDLIARDCGRGYGNHVIVKHDSGHYSLYAHLKAVQVKEGDPVGLLDVLGVMGNTGFSLGCHLHLAVLDFEPPFAGDYDGYVFAGLSSGVSAYTSSYPGDACNGSTGRCLDPKDFVELHGIVLGGNVEVYDRHIDPKKCIAYLREGQAFTVIAESGSWYYLMLPSSNKPESGASVENCANEEAFGWLDASAIAVSSPIEGIRVEVAMQAAGEHGVPIHGGPGQGEPISRGWDGHSYWATGNSQVDLGTCESYWYEIFVPERAVGYERGWVCGSTLSIPAPQCPAFSTVDELTYIAAGSCAPSPPSLETLAATDITSDGGFINLLVNPRGSATTSWFRWGTAEADLGYSTSPFSVGSGTSSTSRSHQLTNLHCDTRYYYQAWADGYGEAVAGEVLSFRTDPCDGGGATDPDDLIRNGNFSEGESYWTVSGFFQADSRFSSYRSYPGYAYLSQFDGSWGNSLYGELWQEVTIPADATSATLEYWYWISTTESSGASAADILTVRVRDDQGNHLMSLEGYSNNDAYSGGYRSDSFDLSSFIGDTVQVHFLGTTDSLDPTIFRLDDVSLTVSQDGGGGSVGFDLRAFAPEVDDATPHLGSKVRFSFSTTNVGDRTAPDDVPVTYYFDGTPIAYDNEETSLGPGEVDGEAESFLVPDTAGRYYVWACLATYPDEPNTSNNCTDPLALDVAEDPTIGPDFIIVETTTSHTTVEVGQEFEMSAVVKNDGNKPFSDINLVRFVATLDGVLDEDDYMMGSEGVTWLSEGQSRTETDTVTAPMDPGSYLAGACILQRSVETDKTNNCSPDPFILNVISTGCQPETVSLTGLAITGSEVHEACQTIHVGPTIAVEAGGSLTVKAPQVVFHDGFRVYSGGTLRAGQGSQGILFADDFADGSIDTTKWRIEGNTVTEAEQQLRVETTVTNQGGWARTTPFTVDSQRGLVLSRRAKYHAANEYTAISLTFNWEGYPDKRFLVAHTNYSYQGGDSCPQYGVVISRNGAGSHSCSAIGVDVSESIPALWDQWFEERIVYDPVSGDLRYYVDGALKLTYNVGIPPADTNNMFVHFNSWGWYTGHYQHMENLVIAKE